MRLEKMESGRYVLYSSFDERLIPREAGFNWNADTKNWYTEDMDIAVKLMQYADDNLAYELKDYVAVSQAGFTASKAIACNMDIPAPTGKDYFPFQKAGIKYAYEHPSCLIADTMGLGKTIEAIGVINLDITIETVLIICPASLKINWKQELEAWLINPMTIGIAYPSKIVKEKRVKLPFPQTNIVIINYDILRQFHDDLRQFTWDLLIVDEAHYLKNPKIIRTQQVIGKTHRNKIITTPVTAKRNIFLTGTPIVNCPVEIYPLIHFLLPDEWNNFAGFTRYYCNAHKGHFTKWDVSGAAHLDELQFRLRQTLMLRRLKEEVLTELPPKMRQIIELPQNGARKVIEAENQIYEQFRASLYELRVVAELAKAGENKDDYTEAVSRLKEGVGFAFGELAIARKETAVAKVPYVLEYLENVSEKIVIFAHHQEVIRQLKEALGAKAVVLTGQTSQKARNKAVTEFQNNPEIQYFLGSIQAAGVGLTLTAASNVIFVELDWVPGNISQAEDRLHRIGARDSVLVQHLVFNESIDAKMAKTLINKQNIIDQVLDNETENIPEIEEGPASGLTTFGQLEKEAAKLSPETITMIHSALRYLSNVCDGTTNINGSGFNSFDATIGKSLAALSKLSQKQAALGRTILRKYSRQLGPQLIAGINID